VKKLFVLSLLLFSTSIFAASYPANTDIGQAGDFCYKTGADFGRTSILALQGPVLYNLPETAASSESGIVYNPRDAAFEFGATLCDEPTIIQNFQEVGMPIGAHGTFNRYFPAYGMLLFGGPQDRGFYFDAAGVTSQDQVQELDPWPGDSLDVNSYAGMSSIECGATTWWHYGTPPNINWSAWGTRCGDYASWDHLGLTGVFGFTKFSGELMLHMSDQSSTGLAIYDMSDRAQPRLLADYNPLVTQQGADPIGIGGYWAEVWGESKIIWAAEPNEIAGAVPVRTNSAISIVDYSNPEDPQLTCFIEFTNARSTHGSRAMYVAFQDGYAYVDQFRVNIADCESRFSYDNAAQTITDPIDAADYASVVYEIPDFVSRGDCSQYARPLGQLILCGGGDIGGTEQIATLDNVSTLTEREVITRTSDGSLVFIHHVIDGTNDVVIQNFGGTLTLAGDTFNDGGTILNVNAVAVDPRINEQGMLAMVQWDEPDTTPPFVAGNRPLDGQTNVSIDTHIHFSMPSSLRSETVTAGIESNSIRIYETAVGTNLPIDLQYSHVGNFAIDAGDLTVDTNYTVEVAGIQDFMGNTMAPYSWSFTTGNAPVTRGQNVFDLLGGITTPPSFSGTPYYPNKSGELAGNPTVPNSDVWAVNPDNDSVTIISQSVGAAPDYTLTTGVLREIAGGVLEKPTSVARVSSEYAVTWADSDVVAMYNAAGDLIHTYTMSHGDSPVSVVADGDTLYVSLYSAEQIIKIDNAARAIVGSTTLSAQFIGLTGNELIPATPKAMALSADGSRLLVTRQVSSKDKGLIYDIATSDMTLTRTIDINKVQVTDDLDHGSGILNNLNSIVISPDGTRALVTAFKQNIGRGTGAGSSGASLDDDNTVRAALAEIDLINNVDINSDPFTAAGTADLDNSADPIAVTYTPDGDSRLVALRGNNRVLVNEISGGNSSTTFATGFAPTDIFTTLRHAFVKNFTDRSVSVIETAGWMFDNRANPPIQTVSTVAAESLSAEELAGLRFFYHSSIPEMGPEGYMTCASCHFDGGDDGQVFDFTQFGEGPRNTISLNGKSGTRFGPLHWTSNFDEIQDFEKQIEELNGGEGLVAGFSTAAGQDPLALTATGLSAALDNLAAYISGLGKETVTRSSDRNADGTNKSSAVAGATLFASAGCAACHSGAATTDGLTHDVGTGGTFKTPMLIDLEDTPPYFHDGSALDLKTVFAVGQHQADTASLNELEKAQLIAYILSIERSDFIDDEVVVTGPDTTPPVITIAGFSSGDTINFTVGDTFVAPNATAVDDVDGSVAVVVDSSGINMNAAGNYVVGYSASDAAGNEAIAFLNVVVSDAPPVANSSTLFYYCHSLCQHTNATGQLVWFDYWVGELANASGTGFRAAGQFGQMEAQTIPPSSALGPGNTPEPWPDGVNGVGYAEAGFDATFITPPNFEWDLGGTTPPDLLANATSRAALASNVLDYVQAQTPSTTVYVYEHWHESLIYPLSEQQMVDYWNVTNSTYHEWFINYYNAIAADYPAFDLRMIPIGPVIADMLTGVPQSGIDVSALSAINQNNLLFEDNAPHGNPPMYFLSGMVVYRALFQEDPVGTYTPDRTIHGDVIADNYQTIVDYIRERLAFYNTNGVNVYGTN